MTDMTDSTMRVEELERCAARKELARARSRAYYAANREACARKAYLKRLPEIRKPKEATLRLHGLPVDAF